MQLKYKLEYWRDENWLVGRLKGIPGVFSQGRTLDELVENIKEAYKLMLETDEPVPVEVESKFVEIELVG